MLHPDEGREMTLHERLREIETRIDQAQEALAMAQGGATDPIVAEEIEALQNERDRLLTEIQSAEAADETER